MSGETEKFVSGWTTDTLKELVDARIAEVGGRIDGVERLATERDRLYKERADAAKEQVGVAFNAAEKAKVASDSAQHEYNIGHNDLIRKMDAQHKETLPREEASNEFKSVRAEVDRLRTDVQGLRESRSGTESVARRSEFNWNQAAQWGAVALLALAELHARGVI